jgi:hypothetical protein
VTLPDRTRGGVLTSGAVLTLTSLPQRTSPVKRGAWMLEVLYHRPPSPPPAAVDPLDETPAKESGRSVRARLEAHRAKAACAGCHSRIDPPGFALENFDSAGQWRTHDGPVAVDASGAFPDGRRFDGPVAFKDALRARKGDFLRGFVEHLLSYALGRKLEYFDAAEVDRIVKAMEADGDRLHRAIVEIVKAHPFRHVRNVESP